MKLAQTLNAGLLLAIAAAACGGDGPTGKLVFVTSSEFHGDLRGLGGAPTAIESADNLCNIAAQAAGRGGVFVAWLSSGSVNAIDRIPDVGPWHATDGALLFNNLANVRTTPLGSIELDETGANIDLNNPGVWTGTNVGGSSAGNDCLQWTSNNINDRGLVGYAHASDSAWTSDFSGFCDEPARLYCLEI